MKRAMMVVLPALLLAGCATTGTVAPPTLPAPIVPIPGGTAGLTSVIGQTGSGLIAMFGQPSADVQEGSARKLQFGNSTCVLDAFLYPKGSGEPVVTYVDARQTDGSPVDRASCVMALRAGRNGRP